MPGKGRLQSIFHMFHYSLIFLFSSKCQFYPFDFVDIFSQTMSWWCLFINVANAHSLKDVIQLYDEQLGKLNYHSSQSTVIIKFAAVFIYPVVFILNIGLITKTSIITFNSFLVYEIANASFQAIYHTIMLNNIQIKCDYSYTKI